MSQKVALITGVTGQDGAYLAEFLLDRGYTVHGVKRRSSSLNTSRIDHLYQDRHERDVRFFLHYGDMTDTSNVIRLVNEAKPTEIYNLAAQSHVQVSFETPEYTANTDALGTLRLLEAIRILGMTNSVRFYQASTSELFGKVLETPQREITPFYPRSPYAAAKLYAYWITVNYREAYGLHASNGILFNHESPVRGETFVTRKISRAVAGAGRLCSRDRRDPFGSRVRRARFSLHRSSARVEGRRTRREGLLRSDRRGARRHRPRLLSTNRGRPVARRSREGTPQASLAAQDRFRAAGQRNGRSRQDIPPRRTF